MKKRKALSILSGLTAVMLASSALAQDSMQPTRSQCKDLRSQATALHQEPANVSDTEDILAMAMSLETLDLALEDLAREYARLGCGRASGETASDG